MTGMEIAASIIIGTALTAWLAQGVVSAIRNTQKLSAAKEEHNKISESYSYQKDNYKENIEDEKADGVLLEQKYESSRFALNSARSDIAQHRLAIDKARQNIQDKVKEMEDLGAVSIQDDGVVVVNDNAPMPQRDRENIRERLSVFHRENKRESIEPIETIEINDFPTLQPSSSGLEHTASPFETEKIKQKNEVESTRGSHGQEMGLSSRLLEKIKGKAKNKYETNSQNNSSNEEPQDFSTKNTKRKGKSVP